MSKPVPTTEPRYSVSEIDRMRVAIQGNPNLIGRNTYFDSEKLTRLLPARVEDMLRTYMLNGTMPEELEAAKDEYWADAAFKKAERNRAREEAVAAAPPVTPDSPYFVAEKITQFLPLSQPLRYRLRKQIEDALNAVIKAVS
jgi:hypothetical protein